MILLLPFAVLGRIILGNTGEALYYAVYQMISIIGVFITATIYSAWKNKGKDYGLSHGFTDVPVLIAAAIFLFNIIYINFYMDKQEEYFIECNANLKEIGMALELYAQDNKALYPSSLDRLSEKNGKKYIKNLPLCPGRKKRDNNLYNKLRFKDSSLHYGYKVSDKFDRFTLWCNTQNIHRKTGKVPEGWWPQYSSHWQ